MKGKYLELLATLLMSGLTWLFGDLDTLFWTAVFMMVVDVITGVATAWKNNEWESHRFRAGLWKKAGTLLAIAVVYRIDYIAPELGKVFPLFNHWETPLRDILISGFIVGDVGSIFENLGEWGVPIPAVISSHLKQLQSKVIGEQKGENVGS